MSAIDLKPFCGNEWEVREALRAPWVDGGWTYATNGHLIVRLPSGDAENTKTPRHPKNGPVLFGKWVDGAGDLVAFPDLPEVTTCPMCSGAGHIEDEHGEKDQCFNCYGSGVDWTFQRIGDSGFNLLYLRQLAELPNARIRTNGKVDPAVVIFDGGQALLMPMREKAGKSWARPSWS